MSHPMVEQLRFTLSEFIRGLKGIKQDEARQRFLPMNCISWNVGHLAWQEQRYCIYYPQGQMPFPQIDQDFRYGAPASTPSLKENLAAWREITHQTDSWLEGLTTQALLQNVIRDGKPTAYLYRSLLQRLIYHYWYHLGENLSIRQHLGHTRLPQFVGDIDSLAPYRPEQVD